ncbi:carbohydrate ABC transporter permease [Paenibacillus ginsengarvi]|uniref:Carbohydrate ABC transporter permease n=1 Tax=Paenibacillus ginsengarvi TaxID=400777 RepID=A0A3B0BT48_9BACL|nr:carbohydrate ABC transporter permease [Paenibacillus ginsengarvi]RKN76030.1 carbohydrate ABC transporter permease [Paenibacillus ginsengarvi]
MSSRLVVKLNDFIIYTVLGLLSLIMIYPLWNVLMGSLSLPHLVHQGMILFWPKGFSLAAYTTVFGTENFVRVFYNTVWITVVGTAVGMLMTITMSYTLSKKRVSGSSAMLFMVFFTMLFSGGMIPTYLVVKSLGLINSLWALIWPNAVGAFNVMIMVSFFRSFPSELEDSGKIDGCNDIGLLFRIIVPSSLPIIATLTLFTSVGQWNTFMQAVLYINDAGKYTLQVLLRQLLFQMSSQDLDTMLQEPIPNIAVTVKFSMIIIATVPILLVYPFLQKYFTKGALIGSLKG